MSGEARLHYTTEVEVGPKDKEIMARPATPQAFSTPQVAAILALARLTGLLWGQVNPPKANQDP